MSTSTRVQRTAGFRCLLLDLLIHCWCVSCLALGSSGCLPAHRPLKWLISFYWSWRAQWNPQRLRTVTFNGAHPEVCSLIKTCLVPVGDVQPAAALWVDDPARQLSEGPAGRLGPEGFRFWRGLLFPLWAPLSAPTGSPSSAQTDPDPCGIRSL